MPKALPFTEAGIRRAVKGARKAGIRIAGVKVAPDGSITVLDGDNAAAEVAPLVPAADDAEASRWRDDD